MSDFYGQFYLVHPLEIDFYKRLTKLIVHKTNCFFQMDLDECKIYIKIVELDKI